ncbi:MAG: hypothetical protein WA976_06295, partial [Candidatus Dormiibacterota bacterium]
SPIAPPLLVPAAGAHSVVRYGVQVGGAVGGTVVQLWIWAGWVGAVGPWMATHLPLKLRTPEVA